MNRIRLFAVTAVLLFALAAVAQQTNARTDAAAPAPVSNHVIVPTADGQLKVLTPRLELTSDQQEQIRPMLQELHASVVKLVQDESLSHQERMGRLHELYSMADARIRTVLNDGQKKKLDQVEQEPHPELHPHFAEAQ